MTIVNISKYLFVNISSPMIQEKMHSFTLCRQYIPIKYNFNFNNEMKEKTIII